MYFVRLLKLVVLHLIPFYRNKNDVWFEYFWSYNTAAKISLQPYISWSFYCHFTVIYPLIQYTSMPKWSYCLLAALTVARGVTAKPDFQLVALPQGEDQAVWLAESAQGLLLNSSSNDAVAPSNSQQPMAVGPENDGQAILRRFVLYSCITYLKIS